MVCSSLAYPIEFLSDGLELVCYKLAVPRHGQSGWRGEAGDVELLVHAGATVGRGVGRPCHVRVGDVGAGDDGDLLSIGEGRDEGGSLFVGVCRDSEVDWYSGKRYSQYLSCPHGYDDMNSPSPFASKAAISDEDEFVDAASPPETNERALSPLETFMVTEAPRMKRMCARGNVLTASDAKTHFENVPAGRTHTYIHLITSSQP